MGKNTFHLVGVDEAGLPAVKKKLRRKQVLAYFANLPACLVAMEARGGSHYWAREIAKLGHEVRLISPQFVKPYVKGNKNDYNDAEGIREAAGRPNIRFVTVKTVEQQDIQGLHRIRQSVVNQRTALANQVWGLLAEQVQRFRGLFRQADDVLRPSTAIGVKGGLPSSRSQSEDTKVDTTTVAAGADRCFTRQNPDHEQGPRASARDEYS